MIWRNVFTRIEGSDNHIALKGREVWRIRDPVPVVILRNQIDCKLRKNSIRQQIEPERVVISVCRTLGEVSCTKNSADVIDIRPRGVPQVVDCLIDIDEVGHIAEILTKTSYGLVYAEGVI